MLNLCLYPHFLHICILANIVLRNEGLEGQATLTKPSLYLVHLTQSNHRGCIAATRREKKSYERCVRKTRKFAPSRKM